MKIMDIRRIGQRVISLCLLMVIVATYSMVTLATSSNPVGELMVTGTATDSAPVTVNGEPAKSGRTVFSPSTVTTPEFAGAVINLGKAGKIELGPNTTFTLSSDSNTFGGDLTAGNVTVLNSTKGINVKILSGEIVTLGAGETVSATSAAASKKAKPGPGGLDWKYWALIIGGAAAVIIIVAATNGNNNTSPVR